MSGNHGDFIKKLIAISVTFLGVFSSLSFALQANPRVFSCLAVGVSPCVFFRKWVVILAMRFIGIYESRRGVIFNNINSWRDHSKMVWVATRPVLTYMVNIKASYMPICFFHYVNMRANLSGSYGKIPVTALSYGSAPIPTSGISINIDVVDKPYEVCRIWDFPYIKTSSFHFEYVHKLICFLNRLYKNYNSEVI